MRIVNSLLYSARAIYGIEPNPAITPLDPARQRRSRPSCSLSRTEPPPPAGNERRRLGRYAWWPE